MLRKKRKNTLILLFTALVFVAAAIGLVRAYIVNNIITDFTANTVELESIDLLYEPDPILYFSKGCNGIRMGITNDQAFSIREALTKDMFIRPLTHDLASETLNAFNIGIVYSKIDSLSDGIYTAKILFSNGILFHEADARPSDMAAFTLRHKNKLLMNSSLISNMTNIC